MDQEGRIRVVCAGLGRTGTLSLSDALKELDYKPYHYVDINHSRDWADFCQGKRSIEDIIQLMVKDGYDSTLENPTCDYYTDILKRFPDAKVILTVRDSPEAFERSWKMLFDSMGITDKPFSWKFPSFFQWIPLFRHLKLIRRVMGTTHLGLAPGELAQGWREKSDGWLGQQYLRHNEHVIKHVAKKNLLVFNVKDGWRPLCDFLGVKEIPETPFPHSKVNDRKALESIRQTFTIAVYSWIPITLSLGVGAWYGVRGRRS